MLGMMSQWVYDKPALDGVRFEAPLKALKDDIAVGVADYVDFIFFIV